MISSLPGSQRNTSEKEARAPQVAWAHPMAPTRSAVGPPQASPDTITAPEAIPEKARGDVMDASFICITCGTQYAPAPKPPDVCAICDEERQFVPPGGQAWTTLKRLERSHMPTFRDEAGLMGIGMTPAFGIDRKSVV